MGNRVERRIEETKYKDMKKKKRKKLKIFILILLLVIIVSVGSFIGYGYYTLSKISRSKVPAKDIAITKPVNILILGVDAGDYTNHTKNNPNRSDTMMLVHYNPITNRVSMLSLPRDTKTTLKGQTEKLNAAHAIGGATFTIATIEALLKVDINYYVQIDYAGFKACIDAIGGVDVTIPRDMNYDAWKINIHFKKGEVVHMDGAKAEEFVRWRKNNNGGGYAQGDIGRISTQQEFMVKVIQKLKSGSCFLKIPSLMNTVKTYVETNMPANTIVEYALKARSINPALVQKEILPGTAKYIGKTSYYIWDGNINDKFIGIFRGIEPTTTAVIPETPSNTNPTPNTDTNTTNNTDKTTDSNSDKVVTSNNTVDKNDVDIVILNSTGKTGLAALYKKKLIALGYKVTKTDNYKYGKCAETIINDYSNQGYGDLLCSDLKFGNIKKKRPSAANSSIVLILGKDSIK